MATNYEMALKENKALTAELAKSQADTARLLQAAEKIRHWHDWGRDNEGMVVSSNSVRGLWHACDSINSATEAK